MNSGGQNSWILPGAAYYTTILRFLLGLLQQEHTLLLLHTCVFAAQLAEWEKLPGAPVHGLMSQFKVPFTCNWSWNVCLWTRGRYTLPCLHFGQWTIPSSSHTFRVSAVWNLCGQTWVRTSCGISMMIRTWSYSSSRVFLDTRLYCDPWGPPMAILQGRGFSPGSITNLSGFRKLDSWTFALTSSMA